MDSSAAVTVHAVVHHRSSALARQTSLATLAKELSAHPPTRGSMKLGQMTQHILLLNALVLGNVQVENVLVRPDFHGEQLVKNCAARWLMTVAVAVGDA